MTNPKDDNPRVKKKGRGHWKKVENVQRALDTMTQGTRKTPTRHPGHKKRRETASASQKPDVLRALSRQNSLTRSSTASPSVVDDDGNEEGKGHVTSAPSVGHTKKGSKRGSMRRRRSSALLLIKEPEGEQIDPQTVYRNTAFELIKNTFSLAFGEDGELRINVDNVYPMLRTIGLNPRSERIMDLVRDASMESTGDIDPADFEAVIMSMVRAQDEELWAKRLEEKEYTRLQKASEKAKVEAEKLRIQQEREKMGFKQEDNEEKDEWAEYEKQKEDEEEEKKQDAEIDELYNNLKMAFRFIDSDGDGVISTQDIYNLMMGLGEMLTDDELFGMVNMADLDCDGKVTFEDFKRFLCPVEDLEAAEKEKDDKQADGIHLEEHPTEQQVTEGEETYTEESKEKTPDESDAANTDSEKAEAEKDKTDDNVDITEISDPIDEERSRRKKSMLWGYMSSTSKVVTVMQKPEKEVKVDETNKEGDIPEIKETPPPGQASGEITNRADDGDIGGLDAIREEEEHSNYDLKETDRVDSKMDNTFTSTAEHIRKLFSRQSSSTSIKVQGTMGNESIGDSGIETMNGSEIREQPDVFDITEDEAYNDASETEKTLSKRKGSLSTCDIYTTGNDDDEDMVDAHHVYESLSRVSSMEDSLEDIKDKLPSDDDDKERRVRSFVNQHMYVDIKQINQDGGANDSKQETEIKASGGVNKVIDENKLARAQFLQKVILKRSSTAPSLTLTRSKVKKPSTPKPSINGLVCSHIDIDLSCEFPPKADIKSKIMLNERFNSTRQGRPRPESSMLTGTVSAVDVIQNVGNKENLSRQTRPRPESAMSIKSVSVVDIIENIGNRDALPQSTNNSRWPFRPLTRPKSPALCRVHSASSRKSFVDTDTEACELSIDILSDNKHGSRPKTPFVRSRSAQFPVSDLPKQSITPKRPHTARPYSTSRTVKSPIMNIEKRDNISVVLAEPFKRADELYPRKDLLTSYHHGFKSIWPTGRKANLIQCKRPFSAFEMNSYSRSLERSEYPSLIDENICKLTLEPKSSPTINGRRVLKDSKVIKLELGSEIVERPLVKKPSSFTPRSEGTAARVLCKFR